MTSEIFLKGGATGGSPTANTPGSVGATEWGGPRLQARAAVYLFTFSCAVCDHWPQQGPGLDHSKRSVGPLWAAWVWAGGPASP